MLCCIVAVGQSCGMRASGDSPENRRGTLEGEKLNLVYCCVCRYILLQRDSFAQSLCIISASLETITDTFFIIVRAGYLSFVFAVSVQAQKSLSQATRLVETNMRR